MENELIGRAKEQGTPFVDGESSEATFVWRGRTPPQLIGDFNDWCAPGGSPPLELGEVESGLWAYRLPLPRDAYIEYSYALNGKRLLDPLNPNVTSNGIGDTNNYFYMPEAIATPFARRQRGVPRGEVARHVVEAGDLTVGSHRALYLYRPPVPGPCPLLVVLDGHDYLRRVKLTNIVDNLIAHGRIQPLALALVDSSPAARFMEYACSEATVSFLTDIVVPYARDHLNLLDIRHLRGSYGVMGASMGGVMSLYAAYRAPGFFGSVLSQSGAFSVSNHDLVIFDLLRQSSARPLHIWMDAGKFEGLLECNRRMNELLVAKGYDVTYREYSGGHNYPAWRDDLSRGLEVLYGIAHYAH